MVQALYIDRTAMYAREYFDFIAMPLYWRCQADPESRELVWAAIVSLNQIADYRALDRHPDSSNRNELQAYARARRKEPSCLCKLESVADALKHGKKLEKNKISKDFETLSESKTLQNDFFSIPDLFAEPNFFFSWTVEVEGNVISVGPLLQQTVDFWSSELSKNSTS